MDKLQNLVAQPTHLYERERKGNKTYLDRVQFFLFPYDLCCKKNDKIRGGEVRRGKLHPLLDTQLAESLTDGLTLS